MATPEELRAMVKDFRMTELQKLLDFAGQNKAGTKSQLLCRAMDLMKDFNFALDAQDKIVELHRLGHQDLQETNDPQPVVNIARLKQNIVKKQGNVAMKYAKVLTNSKVLERRIRKSDAIPSKSNNSKPVDVSLAASLKLIEKIVEKSEELNGSLEIRKIDVWSSISNEMKREGFNEKEFQDSMSTKLYFETLIIKYLEILKNEGSFNEAVKTWPPFSEFHNAFHLFKHSAGKLYYEILDARKSFVAKINESVDFQRLVQTKENGLKIHVNFQSKNKKFTIKPKTSADIISESFDEELVFLECLENRTHYFQTSEELDAWKQVSIFMTYRGFESQKFNTAESCKQTFESLLSRYLSMLGCEARTSLKELFKVWPPFEYFHEKLKLDEICKLEKYSQLKKHQNYSSINTKPIVSAKVDQDICKEASNMESISINTCFDQVKFIQILASEEMKQINDRNEIFKKLAIELDTDKEECISVFVKLCKDYSNVLINCISDAEQLFQGFELFHGLNFELLCEKNEYSSIKSSRFTYDCKSKFIEYLINTLIDAQNIHESKEWTDLWDYVARNIQESFYSKTPHNKVLELCVVTFDRLFDEYLEILKLSDTKKMAKERFKYFDIFYNDLNFSFIFPNIQDSKNRMKDLEDAMESFISKGKITSKSQLETEIFPGYIPRLAH